MTENTQTMTEEEMKEEWDAIVSTLRKNGSRSGARVNTEKLLALLKGIDVNSPRFGYDLELPLLHAILVAFNMKIIHRNDSAKIFRILHECGADGNLPSRFGLTPLYICIASELNMEKKLINILGADLSKEQAHFDYEVAHLDPGKICERMIQLGFKPEEHGRYTRLLFKGKKLKVKRYQIQVKFKSNSSQIQVKISLQAPQNIHLGQAEEPGKGGGVHALRVRPAEPQGAPLVQRVLEHSHHLMGHACLF